MPSVIQSAAVRQTDPQRVIQDFDVDHIRVDAEPKLLGAIQAHPRFANTTSLVPFTEPEEVRRALLARSLRLTDGMVPVAYRAACQAQRTLGVTGELELYLSAGRENPAMHMVASPILLEIPGRLLPLLDEDALRGLFGHELGHYVAHGTGEEGTYVHLMAGIMGHLPDLPGDLEQSLLRFSMLREFTADRVGLLACQDLHAMLRVELAATTGLSGAALTWDTEAYLAQCKDLVEACLGQAGTYSATHPKHSLRAYALWLFSETSTYRRLTGRGAGSRDLREVDALLWRMLGGSDTEQALDHHMLDEPPRELQECALAATVIVALADGELADEEVEAIERVFAPLVADWRAYLDRNEALRRFHESAPVVAAGGGELLRSLFSLLVHVMGADGVVDPREVAAILGVGRSLDCEQDFRRLLAASMAALRVDHRVDDAEPMELPLAVRPDEVRDALEIFLRGVGRRGETSVTLRRILRLIGMTRRTSAAVDRIEQGLRGHNIESDSDLRSVDLDERIELAAPAAFVDEPSAPPPPDLARATGTHLVRALTRLRDQLVSGDGRSLSVRIRKLHKGRTYDLCDLERVSVGRAERALQQIRSRRAASLVDASEAGSHKKAQAASTALLALQRTHLARAEQTGAHDLYLGYPLITGNVGTDKTSGAGYLVRAPLVLHPIELVRDGQGARGFKAEPRPNEPPVVNQSLLRLVFNKMGYAYSDELSDELDDLAAEGGAEAVLERLRSAGLQPVGRPEALAPFVERGDELERRGIFLESEECALLGVFPQSSSDLLQDYDGLLRELQAPEADIPSLLASGRVLLPQGFVARSGHTKPPPGDGVPPGPPVVLADPSQRRVVAECRRNGATVVDGPPGTGKSQVIVNLVADALRRGERVAVVCEKRAALDVVTQRLHALGLRHALGVVHDLHEDRKPLYQQIDNRIEQFAPQPLDQEEIRRIEHDHAARTRALDSRSEVHQRRPEELGVRLGELYTLAAGSEPVLALQPKLAHFPIAKVRTLLEQLDALHPLLDVWRAGSRWRAPDGNQRIHALSNWEPAGLRDFEEAVRNALACAQDYEVLVDKCSAPPESVSTARTALAIVQAARPRRATTIASQTFYKLVDIALRAPDRLRAASDAHASWQAAAEAMVRWERPVSMPSTPEVRSAISILQHWTGRLLRFLVWGWWTARGVVRKVLRETWPEQAGAPLSRDLLQSVNLRMQASAAWVRIQDAFEGLGLRPMLPAEATEAGLAVECVHVCALDAQEAALHRGALEAAHAWIPSMASSAESLQSWDRVVDARLSLLQRRDSLSEAMGPVREVLAWLPQLPQSHQLAELLSDLRRDGPRLLEVGPLLERAQQTLPETLVLLDELAGRLAGQPVSRWRSATLKCWADAWIERAEREHLQLSRLGTAADDHEVERAAAALRELETERSEIEVERVLAGVDDVKLLRLRSRGKGQLRSDQDRIKKAILKETRKKRRIMPLRSFVRRFSRDGLLDLIPVWLVSPETMAVLFPRKPLFDLVIFDEASQCTVESGFPVLLRARRLVIAGDEKQMPPSSYFALGGGDNDDDDHDSQPDGDLDAHELRDMLESESLLTLARSRVARSGLTWHYRCRDEALIAFSNHSMYHGNLMTIPATAGPTAPSVLRWVPVQGGVYEFGLNRPEAERVVDLLHELFSRDPAPSVGVVTLNLKQRQTILDAIDSRAERDPDFGSFWGEMNAVENLDQRPFVKNLEQVQGDERDVIVFSLGYAPVQRTRRGQATGELYVPARFGPLGQRGGERRLNVAISRAKSECHVVSSFEPSLLQVGRSKHEGPKLFKQFLEFCHHVNHGRRTQAERVLDLVRESCHSRHYRPRKLPTDSYMPLVTQLALALEEAQAPFELDVGSSGFRVPLAVLDPLDPNRLALAVLADEGLEDIDAYERHVHRPAVLEMRGWQVMHVTAASWYRRKGEVLAEIFRRVPGAEGALATELWRRHHGALRNAATPQPVPERAKSRAPSWAPSPEAGVDPQEEEAAAVTEAAELPEWLSAIDDPQYRRALQHLAEHMLLSEGDLVNIVGGPRRARRFAAQLEQWKRSLPFTIEAGHAGGVKVYRKAQG